MESLIFPAAASYAMMACSISAHRQRIIGSDRTLEIIGSVQGIRQISFEPCKLFPGFGRFPKR